MDLRLNPIIKQESYRLFAIKYLPRLRRLDGADITSNERSRADCLFANLDYSRSPPVLHVYAHFQMSLRVRCPHTCTLLAHPSLRATINCLLDTQLPLYPCSSGEGSEDGCDETEETAQVAEEEAWAQEACTAHDSHAPARKRPGTNGSSNDTREGGCGERHQGATAVHDDNARRLMVQLRAAVRQQEADAAEQVGMRKRSTQVDAPGADGLHRASVQGARDQEDTGAGAHIDGNMGWSRGLEALLDDKDAMPHDHASTRPSRRGATTSTLSPSAVAGDGGADSAHSTCKTRVVEDAPTREVGRLVEAQEMRVRELEARLTAAHEEASTYRSRALDAEGRAAAAEANVAVLMARAHPPAGTYTPQSASRLSDAAPWAATTASSAIDTAVTGGEGIVCVGMYVLVNTCRPLLWTH